MTPPVCFLWNGSEMAPHGASAAKTADQQFVIGQTYWLEEMSERSWISHRHQFAWLQQAWENLPEEIAPTFPTPEHLRKKALIATGWMNERIIHTNNWDESVRFAKFAKHVDPFADIHISPYVVIVRTARSQRMRGEGRMSKGEFQESKSDIIAWISQLIGVEPDQLRGAA